MKHFRHNRSYVDRGMIHFHILLQCGKESADWPMGMPELKVKKIPVTNTPLSIFHVLIIHILLLLLQ